MDVLLFCLSLFGQVIAGTNFYLDDEYAPPARSTPLGRIKGRTITVYNVPVDTFQSIPFAEKPLENLRFKKPVAVKYWPSGYLIANRPPPGCIQWSSSPFPWLDSLPGHSEDCLYLNIWTPAGSNIHSLDKKSVMFFIHGGGFRIGSNRLDYYDGKILCALKDVIVVTTNYRLGPSGFLYSGTEDAPGNMGLHDVLEALKWVHSNIKHFGGNESSVTVFGQSAGAIATGMLMTSPLAKGLFNRAILQSGSAANLDAEDNDKDLTLSQSLAEVVGCADSNTNLTRDPSSVMSCMRDIDALKLSKAVYTVSDNPQRSLYPRYGDEILPLNAKQAIDSGKFEDMNVLIGVNKNEGSTMVTKGMKGVFGFYGDIDPVINRTFAEEIMRENFRGFDGIDSVVDYYLKGVNDENFEQIRQQVSAASGDKARVCPSVYLAESVAKKGNSVYFYYFQHRPALSPFAPWMGVIHFDETPFVFGYPLRFPYLYTKEEADLSLRVMDIWTYFAKTGTLPKWWPLYSKEMPYYITLDTNPKPYVGVGPHFNNCKFFKQYFES